MVLIPAVLQAVPGEDFTVYAYCNDGAVRQMDVKPLISLGGVFAPLADEAFFRERMTIMNDTVVWDMAGNRDAAACIDLDPERIFAEAPLVTDPLADHQAG